MRTRYRRRRRRPAAIVIGVLVVATATIWVFVAFSGEQESTGCPGPEHLAAGEVAGEVLTSDALDEVTPASPQATRVHVLNGNGAYGQAGTVTGDLERWGFVTAAPPDNDPRFPEFGLKCHGQIRFGAAAAQAARTLSLTVPCAELVRLERPDDIVDLALGTDFAGLVPNDSTLSVLTDLGQVGTVPPTIAAERLDAALDVRC